MNHSKNIISSVESFVKAEMEWLCIAHDFAHIDRVRKIALSLAEQEGKRDNLVIEASALLHEYLDDKFFSETQIENRKWKLRDFLRQQNGHESDIRDILWIIKENWYRKSLDRPKNFPYTIEFQIVEDADRLEAIGAIAIARAFAFGGKLGRAIYDWEPLQTYKPDREIYEKRAGTTIAHFYEKLLLLKDTLHTPSARRIAEERHRFMEEFLHQFYREWNLEDICSFSIW